MLPSRASSAATPRSQTSVIAAASAQRSYTPPAVTATAPGTSRLMVGGFGGAAGAAGAVAELEPAPAAAVLPTPVPPPASSAGAPHAPRDVHVSRPVSGSVQGASPRRQTTRTRRRASGAAFLDLSST